MKIFEEISDQVFCEGDTSKISQISGDMLSPNHIYALGNERGSELATPDTDGLNTTSSSIIIFEVKQAQNKMGAEECKIYGKLKLHNTSPDDKFSMASLRGYVLALRSDGQLEVFKSNDLNALIQNPISYIYNPFDKYTVDDAELNASVDTNVRDIKSVQGTYMLLRNPRTHKQVILTEVIKVNEVYESDWMNSNFVKFALLGIAALFVLVFRWFRKASVNSEPLTPDEIAAANIYKYGQDKQNSKKKFRKFDDADY